MWDGLWKGGKGRGQGACVGGRLGWFMGRLGGAPERWGGSGAGSGVDWVGTGRAGHGQITNAPGIAKGTGEAGGGEFACCNRVCGSACQLRAWLWSGSKPTHAAVVP